MTKEQLYRSNPSLQEKLAEVLALPCLERALQLCEDRAKIRAHISPTPGVHMDTLTSAAYNQALGRQQIVDMIRRLSTKNDLVDANQIDEGEFEHSIPEEFKQARLLKQLNQLG